MRNTKLLTSVLIGSISTFHLYVLTTSHWANLANLHRLAWKMFAQIGSIRGIVGIRPSLPSPPLPLWRSAPIRTKSPPCSSQDLSKVKATLLLLVFLHQEQPNRMRRRNQFKAQPFCRFGRPRWVGCCSGSGAQLPEEMKMMMMMM